MNNPVSKTRLTEMYDKLRLLQWPSVRLRTRNLEPAFTRALVQQIFEKAAERMKQKKQQIDDTLGLTEYSSGDAPQKVKEYRQLTVQNLQMSLFHSSKDNLLKTPFPKYEGETKKDLMVNLRSLTSECFWLGCLMALNNPPLQPDWEKHVSEIKSWNIFPENIKTSDM